MIARVLVAVDGSRRAWSVLKTASEFAAPFGASIVPLRVIQGEAHAVRLGPSAPNPSLDGIEADAMEEILDLLDTIEASWGVPLVTQGRPWRAILTAADETRADLIVIGSHGEHGFDRILGTTAGKVVDLSPRTVLVVHTEVRPPGSDAPSPEHPSPIRRILVAVDGSRRSAGVVALAAELADRFGAVFIPFRAVMIPAEFPPAAHVSHDDPLPGHLDELARAELDRLTEALTVRKHAPVVGHGRPWWEILLAADEHDVDLIVLGSHGYHGLDRVVGTTAARVANMARRNVLVVHERSELLAREHLANGVG